MAEFTEDPHDAIERLLAEVERRGLMPADEPPPWGSGDEVKITFGMGVQPGVVSLFFGPVGIRGFSMDTANARHLAMILYEAAIQADNCYDMDT